MSRFKGTLKAILDEIDRSERAVLASIESNQREGRRKARVAEDERWRWIVRHSAGTVFRGVSREDMLLGRAE